MKARSRRSCATSSPTRSSSPNAARSGCAPPRIAPGDVDLIFQEFGQVAHRLQTRVKGTGLGLPLAKKLAELLGGHIAVESVPGQGSTFSVTLPRAYYAGEESVGIDEDWILEEGKVPLIVVEDDPADA